MLVQSARPWEPHTDEGRANTSARGAKEIQAQIKYCESADEILELIAEHEDQLDHIHCVTAAYRLAKIVQRERRERKGNRQTKSTAKDIAGDRRFEILKLAVEKQISKLDSWVSSSTN